MRACGGSSRVSRNHATPRTQVTTENAVSAPLQPARIPASGTASSAAVVEPTWMPVVYAPVPSAGRQRHALPHGDRGDRVADPHADADGDRQQHDRPDVRRERPRDARRARSGRARGSSPGASRRAPRGRPRAGRRFPCRAPGSCRAALRSRALVSSPRWMLGISGPTPDDLRAQRERRQEQCGRGPGVVARRAELPRRGRRRGARPTCSATPAVRRCARAWRRARRACAPRARRRPGGAPAAPRRSRTCDSATSAGRSSVAVDRQRQHRLDAEVAQHCVSAGLPADSRI